MSSLVSGLSWRSDKLFASLQGAFPLTEAWDAEKAAEMLIYDFSATRGDDATRLVRGDLQPQYGVLAYFQQDPKSTYARMNVSRGLSEVEKTSFSNWAGRFRPEPYTYVLCTALYPHLTLQLVCTPPQYHSPPPSRASSSLLSPNAQRQSAASRAGRRSQRCLVLTVRWRRHVLGSTAMLSRGWGWRRMMCAS